MCYRLVPVTSYACGHQEPGLPTTVDCGSSTCKYSSSHPQNCVDCTSTCVQWYISSQDQTWNCC
ncbi:uncharacterized protein STEHIDRAFT_56575 [Stereum hirsutum FP-91666 SS1]|uniref:uncharacterized protein n=1 Tax=Stereum hirsutum (strain FP-91666) TaxID=721885 RepID=UPI000440FB89|nr:uncharacterized protein STEHIDRAFT_56575 [Stereum hirsutum FP-91666 SS1]EIM87515.1 hypothetical protein STEHIDRAFT_56575 [Stereum hirsutum FP-91666 SS1]